MGTYLGIDLGTTKVAGVVYDSSENRIIGTSSLPHNALSVKGNYYEIDPLKIVSTGSRVIKTLCSSVKPGAIGISTQMHSCMFVDRKKRPLTNLITWLDKRCLEPYRGHSSKNYIKRILELTGGKETFYNTGTEISTGFLGPTVFWFKEHKQIQKDSKVCFLGDYLASALTGENISTDITCAGSSGFYDIKNKKWMWKVIEKLEIPEEIFPPVEEPGTIYGETNSKVSDATSLPAGIPVLRSFGDNQASIVGAAGSLENTVFVNIGTGSQVSVKVKEFTKKEGLDTRYFLDDSYILVGAGLYGGRAISLLERFFRETGEELFKINRNSLYEGINSLMRNYNISPSEMTCGTFFSGTRTDPDKTAFFTNIMEDNFHPQNMVFSVVAGIAFELREYYDRTGKRNLNEIIGTGNALRKNPFLKKTVAGIFEKPLRVPLYEEEAALGSCLLASKHNEKKIAMNSLLSEMAYEKTLPPARKEITVLKQLYKKYQNYREICS
jgi:sedoheptulokinase